MPTIKGTASVADSRARQKALKKTKFSKSFGKPVSLEKVNKPVLTQWIEQKVTSILGFEDEIVSSTAINLFLPSDNSSPDPKKAQLDLTGFLGEQAISFSSELWKLMLEAQASSSGIPQTLLEQKKKEIEERMARENKSQQQTVKQEVRRNQKQDVSATNQLPPERQGSSNKHDNRNNHSSAARGDPPQFQRDKRNGPSADTNGHGTDQFGRAHPPQRSRNAQRPAPRDQYDRNRPSDFDASRRGPRRSRSRERYDYDRDRDYRRRPDHRQRPVNYDQRRPEDRRHDSNRHDDRSAYHHHHHRRPEYHDHDRHRDGEGWRNRHHNYDHEMDDLERRLAHLKQQLKKSDNELCTESTKKLEMFKIESMNWNGTGVDPGPLGTIILVLEVVAVDLLAMNIDEIAAADGATAHILKDPVRHKEAEAASTRQIVAVPTGEVAIAIVLLQKDLKETRVGAVRKDTDDVGREAIAVAKDQSNQNSFLKRLDETV
eukprot:CAMPEP_0116082408 /NCGR_PEP_ID=MMETSP0327-20121206/2719_1 /TAXON_ID=44447 /ORGANISM="Pseudo-nitzschia delicatissima, Strain B596" /LENGTH=487 /DNA_ID=CAMNT_0003573217 /DNA_START=46 /DNA_END=1507 /DNA_ORIENTATION=+